MRHLSTSIVDMNGRIFFQTLCNVRSIDLNFKIKKDKIKVTKEMKYVNYSLEYSYKFSLF